jgi:DNA-3-methyladenine glycosylase II
MWFTPPAGAPDWSAATRHLSRVDPVMRKIIKATGPCTLRPRKDYFVVLCQAIFSQQISTAVAEVLFGRFRNQFPNRRPTPARVIEFLTGAESGLIRSAGISRQKSAYLIDLSRHFVEKKLATKKFSRMPDEDLIEALDDVHGIGRWTAEMFLIFNLNRPDVLPVDDLGLAKGIQRAYRLPAMPTKAEMTARGRTWRPYRSVATWYLWKQPKAPVTPSRPGPRSDSCH